MTDIHIVVAGDTLYSIAYQHQTTIEVLLELNPQIDEPDLIKIGDQINLPQSPIDEAKNQDAEDKQEQPSSEQQANQAASEASPVSVEAFMATCPLNDEVVALHPMRYGVQQQQSDFLLGAKVRTGLPTLSEHQYILRPILEGYLYLFNDKDNYVLQVEFDEQGKSKLITVLRGEAPSEVSQHFPILTQKKRDKCYLLYTHMVLSSGHIDAIAQTRQLKSDHLQQISIAQARKGKADDCYLLDELEGISPDFAPEPYNFDWSLQRLVNSMVKPLKSDYQVVNPDSHIAIGLQDPLGINIELCTLFNAQYDAGTTYMASTVHPYHIAQTTQMIIDRESQNAYAEHVSRTAKPIVSDPMDRKLGIKSSYTRSDDEIEKIRVDRRDKVIKNYQDYVQMDKMQQFIKQQDKFAKDFASEMNNVGKDWLSWLNNEQTDFALALYSPIDAEQLQQKETALANMTANLATIEQGVILQQQTLNTVIDSKAPQGISHHLWEVLIGSNKLLQETSKVTKQVYDAAGLNWDEIQQHQQQMIENGSYAATVATDELQYVIGTRLAEQSHLSHVRPTWDIYKQQLSYRYNYQYQQAKVPLSSIIDDLYAYQVADLSWSYSENSTYSMRQVIDSAAPNNQWAANATVSLYVLNELTEPGNKPALLERYGQWVARKVSGSTLNNPNSFIGRQSKQLAALTRQHQGKMTGLFLIAQVANLAQISNKIVNTKELETKNFIELGNALLGTTQSALAYAQVLRFAGNEQALKQVGKTNLHKLGLQIGQTYDDIIMRQMATVTSDFGERIGGLFVKVGSASYKALPVVGNLFAVILSGYTVVEDIRQGDNGLATTVAVASLGVNLLALALAVAAIPGLNAALGVAALLVGLIGMGLEWLHSWIEDSQLELFLKQSLWGKNSYQYQRGLGDIDAKLTYFADVSNKAVQTTQTKELMAFCDELFRPKFSHSNYDEKGWLWQYEDFTLTISVPGYVQHSSQVGLKILGVKSGNSTLLYGRERKGEAVKFTSVDKLNLQIFESEPYRIQGDFSESDWQTDYDEYKLTLSYQAPYGMPITLRYQVTLDDDAMLFWQGDVDVEIKLAPNKE